MAIPPSLKQLSLAPVFNTKAVALETTVPPDTFRAWERRYGVPRPQRTQGGHRLYSERDIAIIRWLRDRTAEGMNISHAVMLLNNVFEEEVSLPATNTTRGLDQLVQELTRTLTSFDAGASDRLLSEAFSLHPFEQVLLELIQPVMVEIGERWHRGEINIAAEHFATEFMRRKLASLINIFETVATRETIIIGCAPNELHDMGILFASLFLVRRGWKVIYLGARVPLSDLLETIAKVHPDMVCLAGTTIEAAHAMQEVAISIQKIHPQLRFGYGGRIFNLEPTLRETMPGHFLGHDARELTDNVATILNRHS
ncbi:MAG: B12-binding domain-containing protein [Chloroflexales bacterium]|nr:B12-binding domain-containing protein [Chloroflexales bacterium]